MEVNTDDDVKVGGMMYILLSDNFDSKHQAVEDVYHNFTAIYKATIASLDDPRRKFPECFKDDLMVQAGGLLTFCRCALRRIFEETINPRLATLLAEIEFIFLDFIDYRTASSHDVDNYDMLYKEYDLLEGIGKVYFQPSSPIYCYRLIRYELIMEFLDRCVDDFDLSNVAGNLLPRIDKLIVLRNYLALLTKDSFHGEKLEMLIDVENVAYEIARYHYIRDLGTLKLQREHFGRYHSKRVISSDGVHDQIKKQFHLRILKLLVSLSDGSSSAPAPLMSDELLVGYVKCIQENLLELLKSNMTGAFKEQLRILQEGISFLTHLFITYTPNHNSYIKFDFQALARNVGSVICSCFENPDKEVRSPGLFDLIQKIDAIQEEIVKTICCTVLQKTQQESPKKDQLGTLILILQKLKEFMDHGLIINWKNHVSLVLFIFYLIQNDIKGGNDIGDDEFYESALRLDLGLINHEELNGFLISSQVVAFNMACRPLLRRNEKLHWWELFLITKDRVDMHMRVGIIKAIVLSSTTLPTDGLPIAYVVCMQDNIIELLRDKAFDPVRDQSNILHEGLSFLVRLLISYSDEQKRLSHIKAGFHDLANRLGSSVLLCFSNWSKGDTEMKLNRAELSNLVEKLNIIIVETEELLHLEHISKIGHESPKTNRLGSLNLLIENWNGLMDCESDLIFSWKDQFQMIHENLVMFKSFITSSNPEDDESQNICSSIMETSHAAEYLLTTYTVRACPVQCKDRWISEVTKHVKLIAADVMKFNEKKKSDMKEILSIEKDPSEGFSQALLVPTSTDVMMGFEVEMELIRKRLTGHLKKLDFISIVGMPGLGKTTLARKVYEDPYTVNHFDVRAWSVVSQEFNKKEVLLSILGCISQLTDETRKESESELSVMVHKQLTKRRYFIVLDDIWDINALSYLKCFFPDDNRGSKIMLTSRSKLVQCDGDLIEPNCLTDEQSWDLLEKKVYDKGNCPPEMYQTGKEIAKKCKGLPLALVVVGGVLAKGTKNQHFWEQVKENLSSYLANDSESQFMPALELSYKFLPDCLKPMFLYLGAFPEDEEIPAEKLMQLWTSEGFVQKTESVSLEIQAETNLMDLIDRNLIMVAKRRSDGRVKSCQVHDLMRDMCLAKSKNENFMHQIHMAWDNKLPDPAMYQRRLSVLLNGDSESTSRHLVSYKDLSKFSITPPIYSLLFFDMRTNYRAEDIAPVISSLKLLKVLDADMFEVTQEVMDKDLIMLVHLRYLVFYTKLQSIPSSILQLQSLETLIIHTTSDDKITVPKTIWGLMKLKHLRIRRGFIFSDWPDNSLVLDKLETLSTPHIISGEEEKLFRKLPDLKKIHCVIKKGCGDYPDFKFLAKLEALKVSYYDGTKVSGELKLPLTLKELSTRWFFAECSDMSMLCKLPNLEVLKLWEDGDFSGEFWDMGEDDVFQNLKFLKLTIHCLQGWSASSVNFPSLEKLVLEDCEKLEEIPTELGEINTLQKIEVVNCSSSVAQMVREIQEEQENNGNDSLRVYIKRDQEYN